MLFVSSLLLCFEKFWSTHKRKLRHSVCIPFMHRHSLKRAHLYVCSSHYSHMLLTYIARCRIKQNTSVINIIVTIVTVRIVPVRLEPPTLGHETREKVRKVAETLLGLHAGVAVVVVPAVLVDAITLVLVCVTGVVVETPAILSHASNTTGRCGEHFLLTL